MQHFSIPEYGRLSREALGARNILNLQRFDEHHARGTGETIFDWSHLKFIQAKSIVGLLQIPGIVVEILPKIDESTGSENGATPNSNDQHQVRQNLLFMLSESGHFPLFDRDLASQNLEKISILEAFIWVFVKRLLPELRRGQQRLYLTLEENRTCVKGKILLHRQSILNAAHHHRLYVRFDEFESDTWLNRILKAACLKLISLTRMARTQQYLREAIFEMADVAECVIELHHFQQVCLDRNSERFRELLNFCRLVLTGSTPAPHYGEAQSFSLLFPMEVLFEDFIGSILKRHAIEFGHPQSAIHLQASDRSKWLLSDQNGNGRFRLKPDILIDGPDGAPTIILDTKWKRLVGDKVHGTTGVSQSDIYQLHAYAHRFKCDKTLLLYPQVHGATARIYTLNGDGPVQRLKIGFVDLNYDVRKYRKRLIENLKEAMNFD